MDGEQPALSTSAARERQQSGSGDTSIPICSDLDILKARRHGREAAANLDFSTVDQTIIATAISELARNIVLYAREGEISVGVVQRGQTPGIAVIALDQGPGIREISKVLSGGYSTSRSLGLGLSGVRRLMDEFEIWSEPGRGTRVTATKWRDQARLAGNNGTLTRA